MATSSEGNTNSWSEDNARTGDRKLEDLNSHIQLDDTCIHEKKQSLAAGCFCNDKNNKNQIIFYL
jgi:hypothetical protein